MTAQVILVLLVLIFSSVNPQAIIALLVLLLVPALYETLPRRETPRPGDGNNDGRHPDLAAGDEPISLDEAKLFARVENNSERCGGPAAADADQATMAEAAILSLNPEREQKRR